MAGVRLAVSSNVNVKTNLSRKFKNAGLFGSVLLKLRCDVLNSFLVIYFAYFGWKVNKICVKW